MENTNTYLFQVVIHDFSWKKYDEEGSYEGGSTDLEVKRFTIDCLDFDTNEELELFLKGENDYMPEREVEDEIDFINGKQDNVEIDDEVYEQGDGDWDNVKAFRTYDEAVSFRENLIKEFKESGYKDNWYPKNS